MIIPVGIYLEEALSPLASEERRLVFYDPRGRGRSDAVDSVAFSLDHQVADVEAVRRHLGIERVAILGWSGPAMEMAVYAMRHPERVSRLVQVAPVPPRNTPFNEQAYKERERRLVSEALDHLEARRQMGEFEDDPAAFCRALNRLTLPANFFDAVDARSVPDVCVYENEWPENLAPLFRALLISFGDYDFREPLAELEIPRLVIHGEADAFPLKGSEAWVRGHPEARLLVLSEAAHFPFVERPDAFFAAVDTFLKGSWPPEARTLE